MTSMNQDIAKLKCRPTNENRVAIPPSQHQEFASAKSRKLRFKSKATHKENTQLSTTAELVISTTSRLS